MRRFFRALAVVAMTAGAVSACAPTAQNTKASLAQEQANARKLVAQMDADPGIAMATFDLAEVRRTRAAWGLFRDIREDLAAG